ncbi:Cellulose binding domain-containing protein [Thermomonospora echinospora]|uniref:Cellulose binding domain-containing protein n=1 Tax=Thermomonospora echinospora TaxID=1992 RepID=A0A1H6DPT6_9ACTN|nr:cellulose binding domain-containing protein [Thermomonospora echinospora]SEG87164.1 Cellulose binding domain-containing protein [Thermomonospora echinospora]
MGRHTKLPEGDEALDEELPQERPRRNWVRTLVSMPLLPMVALVIAIGVVSYAWGTSQISLNFSGGPPQRQAQADSQDSRIDDGQVPGDRVAGGRAGVLVSFRATRRLPDGFAGTVTIANRTDQPVNGWLLGFKFPDARVLTLDNGAVVKKGQVTWVRNPSATPSIEPGASVRMTFTASGTASRPSACKFNKADCTLI